MTKLPKKPNSSYLIDYTIDETFNDEKFIKLDMRVCHDGVSPNHTHCTLETMNEANKNLELIPILAHVVYDEDGKPMFGSHDMHIEENRLKDGEAKMIYDEIPIGVIPTLDRNNCRIEEYDGRNYTYVNAYIWRDYANYAEDLLVDATESKLSMEISIPEDKISYNAKEKYWDIQSYTYRGVTILSPDLGTGMANALATTENFAEESVKEKMIVIMEELKQCLHDFNIEKESEKGGTEQAMKLSELMKKYNVTEEQIKFETEGLTEEELETAFETAFGSDSEEDETPTEGSENDESEDDESEDDEKNEDDDDESEDDESGSITEENACGGGSKKKKKNELENEKFTKTFEVSFDEITNALYNLIGSYEEMDNDWYYISKVYADKFIMQGMFGGQIYGQKYTVDGDNVALTDERYALHCEYLTDSEKAELDSMRTNYSSIQEKLDTYESAEENSKKEEILNNEVYSEIKDSEDWKLLVEGMCDFSVDEVSEKADLLLAKHVKEVGSFSFKDDTKKKKNKVLFTLKDTKKSPYGNLFSDK